MANENAKRNTRISVVYSLLLFAFINLCAFSAKTLDWVNSIEKGMQEAKRTNKPIMVDFYIDY